MGDLFDGYDLELEMTDFTDTTPVEEFRGKFYFLSNFYAAPCRIPKILPGDIEDPRIYPTSEHAYQAAKSDKRSWREYVLQCPSPAQAKVEAKRRLGNGATYVHHFDYVEWNTRRLEVMQSIVRYKFTDPYLKMKLMSTGSRHLSEGNTWGDQFWGQVNGVGHNHLGHILMALRDELHLDRVLFS